MARSGEPHPGAWRLPADELETWISTLVRATLAQPGFAASLMSDATSESIARISSLLAAVLADASAADLLALVERIDIAPGALVLKLDADAIAMRLGIDRHAIDAGRLISSHPFQLRKRGVETRLVLADAPACQDETLIPNIVRAHMWFEHIRAGQTFDQIAAATGTSKRRIQHMIGLAFLAPDIVRDVMDEKQPLGFTSDWSLRHELPSAWQDQRALLATL